MKHFILTLPKSIMLITHIHVCTFCKNICRISWGFALMSCMNKFIFEQWKKSVFGVFMYLCMTLWNRTKECWSKEKYLVSYFFTSLTMCVPNFFGLQQWLLRMRNKTWTLEPFSQNIILKGTYHQELLTSSLFLWFSLFFSVIGK